MKLIQALEILQRPRVADAVPFSVSLACGFEALHLRTFLTAELAERLPGAQVEVGSGLFDDLPGNLRRAGRSEVAAIAVVIEWADLDPRLGVRRFGGWRVHDLADIVADAELALERLEHELADAAASRRVVCVMPTLPLPPLFPEPPVRGGAHELQLRSAVASFAARLAGHPGVSVASSQRLDHSSAPGCRRDVQAELRTGFPYSLHHASVVGALLADLISPPPPRRGLITDLDDTLWGGILDEAGPTAVSWTSDRHRHGLYQQFLASLADAGVLIGAASRNDPGAVAEVLRRDDLLITPSAIFPIEAGWGPKSASIHRILGTWNIAPDAVVFVDDSPLELDEARTALPGLHTASLPHDDDAVLPFLTHLRSLFGKGTMTDEDGLRLESIRKASAFRTDARLASGADDFLARVGGTVEFSSAEARRERALELLNKCNQFNLNGRRVTEADLAAAAGDGGDRLVTVSYQDRYGPLGMVAALLVSPGLDGLSVDAWAMSCRAFARRVEHHTLRYLFDRFGVQVVNAEFRNTDRNLALQEFFASMLGEAPADPVRLTVAGFEAHAPALVHRVVETAP